MKRTTRGFTLIELLIVMVILGVLMAVLLPAIHKVHSSAIRAAAANQARQIGIASQSYMDDHDGQFAQSMADLVNYIGDPNALVLAKDPRGGAGDPPSSFSPWAYTPTSYNSLQGPASETILYVASEYAGIKDPSEINFEDALTHWFGKEGWFVWVRADGVGEVVTEEQAERIGFGIPPPSQEEPAE